jgi:hypothetical protein
MQDRVLLKVLTPKHPRTHADCAKEGRWRFSCTRQAPDEPVDATPGIQDTGPDSRPCRILPLPKNRSRGPINDLSQEDPTDCCSDLVI